MWGRGMSPCAEKKSTKERVSLPAAHSSWEPPPAVPEGSDENPQTQICSCPRTPVTKCLLPSKGDDIWNKETWTRRHTMHFRWGVGRFTKMFRRLKWTESCVTYPVPSETGCLENYLNLNDFSLLCIVLLYKKYTDIIKVFYLKMECFHS